MANEHTCQTFGCRETAQCEAFMAGCLFGSQRAIEMALMVRHAGLDSLDVTVCDGRCDHISCHLLWDMDRLYRMDLAEREEMDVATLEEAAAANASRHN